MSGFLSLCRGFYQGGLEIGDLSVVSVYQDVFPEELPGLPPEREVVFGIDLLPGTAPSSLVPYGMAPVELKELQTQLREFVVKGSVRPSASPWEHWFCS